MAFFSEIKARLGLDITPFEKGLSQAQGSLGKVVDGAAGKLGNFKTLGTTIATALGLNLETISEGLARMIIGFSKDQEDALLKLVDRSKVAADELEKRAKQRRGDDNPVVRVENFQNDLKTQQDIIKNNAAITEEEKSARYSKNKYREEDRKTQFEIQKTDEARAKIRAEAQEKIGKINQDINTANDQIRAKSAALDKDTAIAEEEARKNILSIDEKIAEARAKIAEPAPMATGENDIDKLKIAQQANEKAKARADLLDLEKEKQDKIDTVVKATAKVREDALNKTLTLEEQILAARDKVNKSEQAAVKSKAGIESANAEFILAQDRANLAELERDKSNKQIAAEEKRTNELKDQQKTLLNQKTTIEQTLAAQAKASLLPSMADVVSGRRNIGGVARGRATQLKQDRAKVIELSDAEQRAREALAGASGPFDAFAAQDALKSGRAIRAQLDQTRSRITTNENLLGARISDANPNAAMEKELMEIKAELKTLNNVTLAPQNTK